MFTSTKALAIFWKTKVDASNPVRYVNVPRKTPAFVHLEANRTYYWCTCGLSKQETLCDGSHHAYNEKHGTDLKPLPVTVDKTKKHLLCRCKHTANAPFCDLSHIGVICRTALGLEKLPKVEQ